MNKRRHLHSNLNTINIAYTRMLEHSLPHRQCMRPPPDLLPSPKRNNSQESQSEQTNGEPARAQGSTIDYSQHSCPDKNDQSFNDHNLKYGKSQTVKQSYFNRLRIHVYRKEKRSKWAELSSSVNTAVEQLKKQTLNHLNPVDALRRENKTALTRKRFIDPSTTLRIKTRSSEEPPKPAATNRDEQNLTQTLHPQRDLKQKEPPKSSRIDRLDYLLNELKLNPELKNKPVPAYYKYRNLSDNSTQINKRLAKLDIRKVRRPDRLQIKEKQMHLDKTDDQLKDSFRKDLAFEAWEDIDIFSTNKNGIVQYITQQEKGQGSEEERVESRRQRKKRKKTKQLQQ